MAVQLFLAETRNYSVWCLSHRNASVFYCPIGRSPLFGHFSTTLLGLDTIRAYGVEETFTDQVNGYQDAHSRAWFTYLAGQTWLNFRLEMLTVLFLAFVAFVSPALKGSKWLQAF